MISNSLSKNIYTKKEKPNSKNLFLKKKNFNRHISSKVTINDHMYYLGMDFGTSGARAIVINS